MKKSSYKYLSAFAIVGVLGLAACSSDDDSSSGSGGGGGAASFSDSIATYTAGPTGTLPAGKEGTVAEAGGDQAANSSAVSEVGLSTGNVGLQNLNLAKVADLGACISQSAQGAQGQNNGQGGASGSFSGNCACTSGGSLDLNVVASTSGEGQTQVADITFDIKYNACAGDGKVFNGTIAYVQHSDAAKGAAGTFIIYRGDVQITGSETKNVKFEFALINGKLTIAVKVDDGTVFFSGSYDKSTKSGQWTITDKNGTWSCQATNGAGKCTHDKGQPERTLTL